MEREPLIGTDLSTVFRAALRAALLDDLGRAEEVAIEAYISEMLTKFLHTDSIFAIRDQSGRRIVAITEMLAEGDVTQNADSFERERQVHKHIGDFLLFWSGVFPEFLRQLKLSFGGDLICDYPRQAKASYHLVSTFDYPPYHDDAPTYRRLSQNFDEYALALRRVRERLMIA
ncbi:MAG: hypothetical protein J0L72_06005 [Armatimonadetes bacterium]|nr:hypothetical protein [Armatimonadota bacterium]